MGERNDKGFTLVELLVSIVILALVGTAVVGFMNVGSKTYAGVNNEVSIQYEAQLAVNQIKDLIIDTNRGLTYCLVSVDGTYVAVDPENPNSETEILNTFYANPANVDKVKRCLLIYNEKEISSTVSEYPLIKITWNPETQTISYIDKTFTVLSDLEADKYLTSIAETNYKLLAEYVNEFSIGLTHLKKQEVNMVANFARQGRNYRTTPMISLRNRIFASDDLNEIYNKEDIIKDNLALRVYIKKDGNRITEDKVYVAETTQYEGEVEMQIGATSDNFVTWTLEGSTVDAGKTKSRVDQDGRVSVSRDEKAAFLTLKAESPKLPGRPAAAKLEVCVRTPSVEIVPENTNLIRGGSADITTNITNINNPTYEWSIKKGAGFPDDYWQYNPEYKLENIVLLNRNGDKNTISVNSQLHWVTEFQVIVVLTVRGTVTNSNGLQVPYSKTEEIILTIKPVKVVMEFPEGNKMGFYKSSIKVVPRFENLMTYSGKSWPVVVKQYIDATGNPINGNLNYIDGESFHDYSLPTCTIALDKGGKEAFNKTILAKKQGMYVSFTFAYEQTGGIVSDSVYIEFEYER